MECWRPAPAFKEPPAQGPVTNVDEPSQEPTATDEEQDPMEDEEESEGASVLKAWFPAEKNNASSRLFRLFLFALRLFPSGFPCGYQIDHSLMRHKGKSVPKLTNLINEVARGKASNLQTSTLHGFLAKQRQWVELVARSDKSFGGILARFKSGNKSLKEGNLIDLVSKFGPK
jgi:hypothetical protein